MPIPLLFTKLIKESFKYITHDIYIILDDLDEADSTMMNPKEMGSEIDVLIKGLGSLKSEHILFISRSDVSIEDAILKLLTKFISDKDNSLDIETYVHQQFSKSETLQKWYPNDVNHLIEDFLSKFRGGFHSPSSIVIASIKLKFKNSPFPTPLAA